MSERLMKTGFLKPLILVLSMAVTVALFGFVIVRADTDPNPSEIDLYYLDDTDSAVIGSIPSKYQTSYQIKTTGLTGTPSYRVVSNTLYAAVSSDGVITPKVTTWYKNGNYWTTSYIEGAVTRNEYSTGTSVVRVTCGDYSKDITVHVKDYANTYADDKIDDVLSKIITTGMTDLQKLTAMTKWVAENTDYSASYSGYVSMMIHDCGDCWASTSTILTMCERCGVKAEVRIANHDSGAGSGHRNVIALCEGSYYVADAGYSGSKPRYYRVAEEPYGFSRTGSTIYQYDGFEKDVVVPEKIGSTTITKLGTGEYSIFNTNDIKSIKISKTIQTVSPTALSGSPEVKVTVDTDNQYLTVSGGVLYTKDKTKLIFAPSNITSLTIDKNTAEIADVAMYNLQLSKISIPGNVKTIGERAFIRAAFKQVEIEEGLTTIGDHAFYSCSNLTTLSLPSTLTKIGEGAFDSCSKLKNIYYGGTKEQWDKITLGSALPSDITVHFQAVRVTGINLNGDSDITLTKKDQTVELKAKVIPSNAENQEIVYSSDDTKVAKIDGNKLIAVGEGSCTVTAVTTDGGYSATYNVTVKYPRYKLTVDGGYMYKYVYQNGSSTRVEFTECEFIEGDSFTIYKRAPSNTVTFKQWVIDDDVTLSSGTVTSNSITVKMPGRDVTIKAEYSPVLVSTIYVNWTGTYYSYLCPDMTAKFGVSVYPSNAHDNSVVWSTSDPSVATVDNEGNLTAVAAGTCKVIATASDGSGISGSANITVKDHTWNNGVITKEATCEEDGVKTFTCTHTGCGKTKTETITKYGHSIVPVAAKMPTKTEAGNIAHYKCTRCGKLFSDEAGKNPLSESDVILKATGHNLTKVAAKAATCTEDGNIEYYVCNDPDCNCGKCYSDPYGQTEISKASTVIHATGHKLTENKGKAAGCETDGVETYYKCSVCNKLFSDKDGKNEITKPVVIPALGHDPEHVDAKEPTYDDAGWIEHYVCKRCGKLFADSACKKPLTDDEVYKPCKKHVLTKVAAVDPTCTQDGHKEYYECKDEGCGCKKIYEDKFGQKETTLDKLMLPSTGHNLTEVTEKAPTCTETGNKAHWKCTNCGHLFSDSSGKTEITKKSITIDPLGHDWEDEGKVTTKPGCETPGVRTFGCKRDGCKATKTESIDPLGHDKDHLEHHAYKAPTRDSDGNEEYYVCPRCGKKFADADCTKELADKDILISAIGAAKLGEEANYGDFRYRVTYAATNGTGTVTLIGVVNAAENVSIPATAVIKQTTYIVNRIGPKAFYNDQTIKTLYVNASIVAIDNYAFYGCSNLVKVSGGSRLKTIGSYAFAGCPRLSSFKLSSKVLSKIGTYCFKSDSKLKTIYIKSTTKLTKKGVKKSLKGSKVKTVKVKKSKVRKYRKYFTKKNCGRKVKVKK